MSGHTIPPGKQNHNFGSGECCETLNLGEALPLFIPRRRSFCKLDSWPGLANSREGNHIGFTRATSQRERQIPHCKEQGTDLHFSAGFPQAVLTATRVVFLEGEL